MIDNSLIKTLLIIKHKHFMSMRKIENKKEILVSIKREDNLKNTF